MSKYWQDRFIKEEKRIHELADDEVRRMQLQYEKALSSMNKDIEVWYSRIAKNNEVSLAEAKKLLNNKELKEFKWSLEEYIKHGKENGISKDWSKQLENASAKVHIERLEAMKLQVRGGIEKLYNGRESSTENFLKTVYKDSYYHTAFEIAKGTGIGTNLYKLNDKLVNSVIKKPWAPDGKNFSDRIWDDKNRLINTLHTELTQGFIRGDSLDKLTSRIAEKMNVSKTNASRLVHTESAAYSSKARLQTYKDLGVEKYEIVATLDSRTSEICQELDGKVFDRKDYEVGTTAPPFHVRCRTTTAPYFEDDEGERAARNEETGKTYYVPADMTYRKWEAEYYNKGDGTTDKEETDIFVPAKSREEAKKFADKLVESGNIDITEKLHLNTINDFNEAMYNVNKKYGRPLKIKKLKINDKGHGQANYHWDEESIGIKGGMRANQRATVRLNSIKNFEKKWLSTNHEYHTYYHEIGHAVWADLPKEAQKKIAKVYEKHKTEAYEEWLKLGKAERYRITQHDIFAKKLSQYGMYEDKEFFSEAFAEIMANKMREPAKEVADILDKYYKRTPLEEYPQWLQDWFNDVPNAIPKKTEYLIKSRVDDIINNTEDINSWIKSNKNLKVKLSTVERDYDDYIENIKNRSIEWKKGQIEGNLGIKDFSDDEIEDYLKVNFVRKGKLQLRTDRSLEIDYSDLENKTEKLLKKYESIKDFEDDILLSHYDRMNGPGIQLDDTVMKKMFKNTERAELPTKITKKEFDYLLKKGEVVIHRGVSDAKYIEQFKNGDLFFGKGTHGNGTYTTLMNTEALLQYGKGKIENTISMIVDPKAKIVDYGILKKEYTKIYYDPDITEATKKLHKDLGRFATSLGYDAINYENRHLIILNRSVIFYAE